MSIIKSIKQVLGLGPAAENHFWDGSVPNQLSLKRGTPDAPGAELIKALNGVLSFPNQGQDLASNGYVKLPGGLIIQWGEGTIPIDGVNLTLPTPFANSILSCMANVVNTTSSVSVTTSFGGTANPFFYVFNTTTGASVGGLAICYIAIGY